ncbi:MAG: lysylphosphatidylglycerol synthase domain-containing protein, partial [Chloroflexota bacterium]|nr:lysylphosphatidylglycerol synthase domain-containing protein [Chloroflexota bacterium]
LLVLLVVVFFARALYDLLPQVLSYEWVLDPTYIGIATVLLLVRGPVPVYAWAKVLEKLGHVLPWRMSTQAVYYSALAGFVPGSVWHAVSRVMLVERQGVPRLISAISVTVESVLVLLGAALVSSLTLFAWQDAPTWLGLALILGLLLLVTQPGLLFRLLNWVLVRLKRRPLEIRLTARDMLVLLLPYLLNWLIFAGISFALVAALYPSLPLSSAPVVGGIFTASWVAGYLAVFVPQGLVVREFFIVSLLTTLLGVPAPIAAAAALLSRAWSMLGIVLWAGIASRL